MSLCSLHASEGGRCFGCRAAEHLGDVNELRRELERFTAGEAQAELAKTLGALQSADERLREEQARTAQLSGQLATRAQVAEGRVAFEWKDRGHRMGYEAGREVDGLWIEAKVWAWQGQGPDSRGWLFSVLERESHLFFECGGCRQRRACPGGRRAGSGGDHASAAGDRGDPQQHADRTGLIPISGLTQID